MKDLMTIPKWIGPGKPAAWPFKKDVPAHMRDLAIRVDFPFFRAWIVRDQDKRVYFGEDENAVCWAQTHSFCLTTPGWVIGLRDMQSAEGYPWAHEWRRAVMDCAAIQSAIRSRILHPSPTYS